MTPREAAQILSHITYKPGCHITAEGTDYSGRFRMKIPAIDSESFEPTTINYSRSLDRDVMAHVDKMTLLLWCRNWIQEWEQHECDEWLRYKGKRLSNAGYHEFASCRNHPHGECDSEVDDADPPVTNDLAMDVLMDLVRADKGVRMCIFGGWLQVKKPSIAMRRAIAFLESRGLAETKDSGSGIEFRWLKKAEAVA